MQPAQLFRAKRFIYPALSAACFLLILTSILVFAEDRGGPGGTTEVSPPEEYRQKIEAARDIAPLGDDLFGDSMNAYTGAVQFSVTDIDLPGNNDLPVRLARYFDGNEVRGLNVRKRGSQSFSDWNFDIPHLHGDFANTSNGGWTTGSSGLRCSQSDLSQSAPPPVVDPLGNAYAPDDYWHGTFLYVPGKGDDELLHLADSATQKPLNGLSYHWATKGRWYFSCLPNSVSIGSGSSGGEAFLAQAPDGTKYWFNQIVFRHATLMVKAPGKLMRDEYWALPTRVEDRFGNFVTYSYSAIDPWNIIAISGSDGRQITLTYDNADGSGRVLSASDGARTWSYGYSDDIIANRLTSVLLPDGSHWGYDLEAFQEDHVDIDATGCGHTPYWVYAMDFPAVITHPSGAVGTFTFNYKVHGRSYVPQNCWISQYDSGDRVPPMFTVLSLTKKQISGPGLPTRVWTWIYPDPGATGGGPSSNWSYDWQCSTGCPTTKIINEGQPDGSLISRTFGIKYGVNEGLLLKEERLVYGPTGYTPLNTQSMDYVTTPSTRAFPRVGDPYKPINDPTDGWPIPLWRQQIVREGTTFTWQVNNTNGIYNFDGYAQPLKITKASSN